MARPLRLEYEGAVYHVTIRGNHRNIIFRDDGDREYFVLKLSESIERYDVRLYLYCFMTNHVHLVLETPRGNLSRFMHRLQTAYTVFYNRKHNQSGHLMQGRFGSSVVDEDEYILKLSRYIHLNPVFVKAHKDKPVRERIALLRKYPWSSYRSYIRLIKPFAFVEYKPILEMMACPEKRQSAVYRRFVESGISNIDAAFINAKQDSRLCIGSEECHERMDGLYQHLVDGRLIKEDVSFRRMRQAHAAEDVLTVVCQALEIKRDLLMKRQRNSFVRAIAAKALCDYCGMTQRQIAEILGLRTGVAVSCQLRKLSTGLKDNEKLQCIMSEINKQLGQ